MKEEVHRLSTSVWANASLVHSNSPSYPQSLQLLSAGEAEEELGLVPHDLMFSASVTMETRPRPPNELVDSLLQVMQK